MGRSHERWPSKALAEWEKTVDELKELERKARAIQDALVLGNTAEALRDLSDVRVMALECVSNLVRARIGKYEQQQKEAPRWNQPETIEKKSTEAVVQVMTLRRP